MRLSLRAIFRLQQRVEAFILSSSIILIALLTIANVFSRAILNNSLAATEELSRFLIIVVTFVGLSYAASTGRHIRMTALYDQMGERARKYTMIFIAGSTSVLMFVMAWFAVTYVSVVHELGSVTPVLQTPLYLVYLAAPVGLTLAGIQYAFTTWRNITGDGVFISYSLKDEYLDEGTLAVDVAAVCNEDEVR